MTDEPFYVAQTLDLEHTRSGEARRAWFEACADEVRGRAQLWRATISLTGNGLLFEAWDRFQVKQGEPRWSIAAPAQPEARQADETGGDDA